MRITFIFLFLVSLSCHAGFYSSHDDEAGDFLLFVSSSNFDDVPIYDCRNGDAFGEYAGILSAYLEIAESFVENRQSIQGHVSNTFESDRVAVDAWGIIENASDLGSLSVRSIYSYMDNYFIVMSLGDSVTFVNLVVEDGDVLLTNKILRDGQVFNLVNVAELNFQAVEPLSIAGSPYYVVPMYVPDGINIPGFDFSRVSIDGTTDILVPSVLIKNLKFFCNIDLDVLVSGLEENGEDNVYYPLKALYESSRLLLNDETDAFVAQWASGERDRVSAWLSRDDLKPTILARYGLEVEADVSAVLMVADNRCAIYLSGGDEVVYLRREYGEWRLSESSFWNSSIRSILESDKLKDYVKLGCAAQAIQEVLP